MDIKKLKPNGNWQSGKYTPVNPSKYIGDTYNIIYRSSWERKFCQYCDINPNITKWSSEPTGIPYWSPIDKKEHQYFVDYYIQVKKGEVLENWLIEIKPEDQYALHSHRQRRARQRRGACDCHESRQILLGQHHAGQNGRDHLQF